VSPEAPAELYCRDVERYLCLKNDGHLIRIVGPAFEQVCGWSAQGVPISVVRRGIDRTFERYYAKGPRRRPVRIEFCEADVLDVFDEWRRAVGAGGTEVPGGGAAGRRVPLQEFIERAVARLAAARRTAGAGDERLDETLAELQREIEAAKPGAGHARGEARARIVQQMAEADARLMIAARRAIRAEELSRLEREAATELAPFRERMEPAAFEQSLRSATDRLVRQHFQLPELSYL
jgi:hypothetical protein